MLDQMVDGAVQIQNLAPVHPKSNAKYSTMRDLFELKVVFTDVLGPEALEQVLHGKRGIVNTCGSGMTAAIIWLALQMLQVDSAIYDESSLGPAMPHVQKARSSSQTRIKMVLHSQGYVGRSIVKQ